MFWFPGLGERKPRAIARASPPREAHHRPLFSASARPPAARRAAPDPTPVATQLLAFHTLGAHLTLCSVIGPCPPWTGPVRSGPPVQAQARALRARLPRELGRSSSPPSRRSAVEPRRGATASPLSPDRTGSCAWAGIRTSPQNGACKKSLEPISSPHWSSFQVGTCSPAAKRGPRSHPRRASGASAAPTSRLVGFSDEPASLNLHPQT